MEQWVDVLGWEGIYRVSNFGRVESLRTGTILKPMRTGSKRPGSQRSKVRFSSSPRIDEDVAHLVLMAFIGPRPIGSVAMHLDDDSSNNHISNLRWGSHKENVQQCTIRKRRPNQKLAPDAIAAIKVQRAAGVSGKQLSVLYGVSPQRICDIHKGRTSL